MLSHKLLTVLLLFCSTEAFAQQLEKKLLFTLEDTSINWTSKIKMSFKGDEYCYSYQQGTFGRYYTDDTILLTTKQGIHGPFSHVEGRYGPNLLLYDEKNKSQYVKSVCGVELYGPYDGVVNYDCGNGFDVAYTVAFDDSIHYYINGQLVARTERFSLTERPRYFGGAWCAISQNGNTLYTIEKGRWKYLFANSKMIDSSRHNYGRLGIDDRNNYYYSLGDFVVEDGMKRLKPIAHKAQPIVHPGNPQVPIDNHVLRYSNDTVLHYGNIGSLNLLTLPPADKLLDSTSVASITNGHVVFSYNESISQLRYPFEATIGSGPTKIWVNGVEQVLPYAEVSLPCIDSNGRYAFFGLRDYYLYKNVNGIETKEPLSKHGVRAKPISIDVNGNTLCYYETIDSVFVYENDRLIASCPEPVFELEHMANHVWNYHHGDRNLQVLSIGDKSYVVYNNTLSPALLDISSRNGSKRYREGTRLDYGAVNKFGYWVIQKMSAEKYHLIINHQRIALPSNISNSMNRMFLGEHFYLTDEAFVFYTLEGLSVYRYKMNL